MHRRTLVKSVLLAAAIGSLGGLPRLASAAPSKAELVELLKGVDDRQRNQGDWRSNAYIEQKEKDSVHEAQILSRSGLPAHRSEFVVL